MRGNGFRHVREFLFPLVTLFVLAFEPGRYERVPVRRRGAVTPLQVVAEGVVQHSHVEPALAAQGLRNQKLTDLPTLARRHFLFGMLKTTGSDLSHQGGNLVVTYNQVQM